MCPFFFTTSWQNLQTDFQWERTACCFRWLWCKQLAVRTCRWWEMNWVSKTIEGQQRVKSTESCYLSNVGIYDVFFFFSQSGEQRSSLVLDSCNFKMCRIPAVWHQNIPDTEYCSLCARCFMFVQTYSIKKLGQQAYNNISRPIVNQPLGTMRRITT